MKKCFFYFAFLSFVLNIICFSQEDISFTSLSGMTSKRFGMGYTTDGINIYAISGGTDSVAYISSSMEYYNINENTWTEISNDLIPRRYCSAEYIPSLQKIFIFNGYDYDWVTDTTVVAAYSDTVEIYDVNTSEITYSKSNPYPVNYAGSAVWNDKIYVFGGSNYDGYSNRLYEFDPETLIWKRLSDMPEAKTTGGEIIDGILYVFGGYNGATSMRIDGYDIANQTWTFIGNMPVGISSHATTVLGKYIWLVGSYDNLQSLAIFDSETYDFTTLSNNMIGRRHAGTVILNNNLYVFGGGQTSSIMSSLNSTEYADISNYVVSINTDGLNLPTDLILHQNYPNPFNPSTTINYTIPKDAFVSLRIYNSLGEEVTTLFEAYQKLGEYEVLFNGYNLSSGIYFCNLQFNDRVDIKKIVLLK